MGLPQKRKPLVLFHSRTGNTRFMAEAIAAATGAGLVELTQAGALPALPPCQGKRGPDLVFLGGPVRFGLPARPLRAFARRKLLSETAVAPFCCCAFWPGPYFRRLRRQFAPARVLPGIAFRAPLRRSERTEARRAAAWARQMLTTEGRTRP